MTIIAWDGKTLAADKLASYGSMARTTTKIFRIRDCLVGYSGDQTFGEQMLAWFKRGENPDDFPASQRDKDDWISLLVIRPGGAIHIYERTPYPLSFEDIQYAIGSGREFAIAAMYCGKSAVDAVLIASMLDTGCGQGVDELTL